MRCLNSAWNFARRSKDTVGPVCILLVLDDAIEMMGTRLRAAHAVVDYVPANDPIWVIGGRLRLQQVFVNLLSSALDAMACEDTAHRHPDRGYFTGKTEGNGRRPWSWHLRRHYRPTL